MEEYEYKEIIYFLLLWLEEEHTGLYEEALKELQNRWGFKFLEETK